MGKTKKKPAAKKTKAKPAKNKPVTHYVLHSHDEGSSTYMCTSEQIAWYVAAKLVCENMHEFRDAEIVDEDGVACAKALLEGDFVGAVQLYNECVSGKSENIEVDSCGHIYDAVEPLDKKELEEFLKQSEASSDGEDSDGEEEVDEEDEEFGGEGG